MIKWILRAAVKLHQGADLALMTMALKLFRRKKIKMSDIVPTVFQI